MGGQQQQQQQHQTDTEEAAEFVATVRGEHVAMKEWFNNNNNIATGGVDETVVAELARRYGPYPSLWKEVLNWPGWKETRRAYLRHLQRLEGGVTTTTATTSASAASGQSPEQQQTTTTQQQQQQPSSDGPTNSNTDGGGTRRKRKSRWGTSAASSTEANTANNDASGSGADNGNHKRPFIPLQQQQQQSTHPAATGSSSSSSSSSILNIDSLTPHQQEELRKMQAQLRVVNEHMENLEAKAERIDALPRGHRERSPSPPPIYGPDGKRRNTRAVRWRERYSAERQDLLEAIVRLSSRAATNRAAAAAVAAAGGSGGSAAAATGAFMPGLLSVVAGGAGPLAGIGGRGNMNPLLGIRKRVKKIRIPVEEHPQYNFIGLIIGPRGKTQKELESKTGCKIAIRGRGSVKEGARGRRDGKVMEGDQEALHVVITGDDQKSVDAASDMIEQMLVVIDDEKNVHKQNQLRELALLNGTLKEEEFCQVCGEKGHRAFECPRRFALQKTSGGIGGGTMNINCAICGDTSHPTRDCTQKQKMSATGGAGGAAKQDSKELDSDYMSFMAELDGKKVDKSAVAPATATAASLPPRPPDINLPPPPPPTGTLPPPPPPGNANFPPPPPSLPPPPPMAGGVGVTALAAAGAGLAPPTVSDPFGSQHAPPPPPPQQNYNFGQQPQHHQQQRHQQHQQMAPQQQYYGGGGGGGRGQPYQQQQHNGHQDYYSQQQQQQPPVSQQQQQPQQPDQQQQQVEPGDETSAWDPSSYYGSYGNNQGAGGFNWWEQ